MNGVNGIVTAPLMNFLSFSLSCLFIIKEEAFLLNDRGEENGIKRDESIKHKAEGNKAVGKALIMLCIGEWKAYLDFRL